MARYLLDTNHLSDAAKPVSKARDKLLDALHRGDRLGTCVPVLCELEIWLQGSSRYKERRKHLDRLLTRVSIWPLEPDLAPVYADTYLFAQAKGKVLSQVDLMVAAMAKVHKLTVLSADKDFAVFPDIRVENWLK